MKLLRKILPLTAVTAVALIPVTATSCSNVMEDMLSKQYIPSFEPLPAQEMSATEASRAHRDYFKDHQSDITPDFYWGASFYAINQLGKSNPLTKVESFYDHIYSFKMETDATTGMYKLSYKLKCQVQVRHNTKLDGTGSYTVNTYDIYWELNNIEFYAAYTETVDDKKLWTITPVKYDITHSCWYQELKGNENLVFDIKAVYKGYSETGAQNYVLEANEAAIVDEAHKYVPELNEVYTSSLLFNSYYLTNITPRFTTSYLLDPILVKKDEKTYTLPLTVNIGELTRNDYNGEKLKFSLPEVWTTVDSYWEDKEVPTLTVSPTEYTIDKNTQTIHPEITLSYKNGPHLLDRVYFCLEIEHEKHGDLPAWKDWLVYNVGILE